MLENPAWAERYRPTNIQDVFLPESTREWITNETSNGSVPSMLFTGPPGIGKTTVAMALGNQFDLETMKMNTSMYGNIDTLRTDVHQFASTVSFNGNKKLVIFDEADGMTSKAQDALRAFMDDYSTNVSFILTANRRHQIDPAIVSRLTEVQFLFPKNERSTLAKGLYKFLLERFEENSIEYSIKDVQKFLVDRLEKSSDIRKIITDAQRISTGGLFNLNRMSILDVNRINEMMAAIKSNNFDRIRTWAGENSDIDGDVIYRAIYDGIKDVCRKENKLPVIVSILNEHQFRHAIVADKEINLADCLNNIASNL